MAPAVQYPVGDCNFYSVLRFQFDDRVQTQLGKNSLARPAVAPPHDLVLISSEVDVRPIHVPEKPVKDKVIGATDRRLENSSRGIHGRSDVDAVRGEVVRNDIFPLMGVPERRLFRVEMDPPRQGFQLEEAESLLLNAAEVAEHELNLVLVGAPEDRIEAVQRVANEFQVLAIRWHRTVAINILYRFAIRMIRIEEGAQLIANTESAIVGNNCCRLDIHRLSLPSDIIVIRFISMMIVVIIGDGDLPL